MQHGHGGDLQGDILRPGERGGGPATGGTVGARGIVVRVARLAGHLRHKLAYGFDAGDDLQWQGLLIIPWDPFEQDFVRPTLQPLERRSGRAVSSPEDAEIVLTFDGAAVLTSVYCAP